MSNGSYTATKGTGSTRTSTGSTTGSMSRRFCTDASDLRQVSCPTIGRIPRHLAPTPRPQPNSALRGRWCGRGGGTPRARAGALLRVPGARSATHSGFADRFCLLPDLVLERAPATRAIPDREPRWPHRGRQLEIVVASGIAGACAYRMGTVDVAVESDLARPGWPPFRHSPCPRRIHAVCLKKRPWGKYALTQTRYQLGHVPHFCVIVSANKVDFDSSNEGTNRTQASSLRRKIAVTCAGLALPREAFIACPTSALNAFSLPDLNSATVALLAASTWSTMASIAAASEIWRKPCASM